MMKFSKHLLSGSAVGGMCLFRRGMKSKPAVSAFELDTCAPAFALQSHTFHADTVITAYPLVSLVQGVGCRAQITNPVIVRVPVFVIEITIGPDAVNVKPSESVCPIETSVTGSTRSEPDAAVASIGIQGARRLAQSSAARALSPPEVSCIGIVAQNALKFTMIDHDTSVFHGTQKRKAY